MRIKEIIGPAFYCIHKDLRDQTYSSFWLRGGRGSLKSSFVALEIVMGIVSDPSANAACFRKVGATLKDSVMPTLIWAIDKLGWAIYFKVNKADNEITYIPTGQKIVCRGLDDPQKLKSIKAKKGYFKYLWFEEGAEYTDIDEMQSVIQSVLRGGSSFVEFVTYNPPAEPFAWINEESKLKRPSRRVHESNYLQAPPDWLGPKFIADAAEMKALKPEKYAHVYMGVEVGRTDAIIFSGCYTIGVIDPTGWDGPYFGADWGFSQDPTVLLKMWVKGRQVYFQREEFGIGVELDDIPAMFDKIEGSRKYRIRADCARPETISHVKNKGFNIIAAEKWSGSVEDGIIFLQSQEMTIDPSCVNLIQEARDYRYKIDRLTRDVLPDIIDKHNHGWDAARYGLDPLIKHKPKGLFSSGALLHKKDPAINQAKK